MRFTDRQDAARRLLAALPELGPDVVVEALPRGGVPLAAVVARALSAPLDLVLVRKIGVPGHEELAVAAVTDGAAPVINRDVARQARLTEEDIDRLARPQQEEIVRRRALYLGGRAAVPVAGRTVLVVDDGIATGATMRAALKLLRAKGAARIVVAVPVAPREALAELRREADEVVCLTAPEPFYAVGQVYDDFAQVSDREVVEALGLAGAVGPPPAPQPG